MSPLNTKNYPYWLEAAIHSGLGPPTNNSTPNTLLTTALQTLGLQKQPSSTAFSAFKRLSSKRVIIVGLDGVGKRALMRKHISIDAGNRDVETRIPFIGCIVETVADRKTGNSFHAMDVGGCAPNSYYVLQRAVCTQGDAIVWVVDASDRERVVEAGVELGLVSGLSTSQRLDVVGRDGEVVEWAAQTSPVAVLVDKWDIEGSMTLEEVEVYLRPGALERFGDRRWKIFGVTIESGKGVLGAMEWIAEQLSLYVDEKR